jgi:hypothetical protein
MSETVTKQKIDIAALREALAKADAITFGEVVDRLDVILPALPALLDELEELRRLTTPEPIGEKHRDGNWWMVWAPGAESWFKCRWRSEFGDWQKGGTTEHLMSSATHALPMPPEVKP